jgi:glycosyltransferase involved in cell wall biosynthesis
MRRLAIVSTHPIQYYAPMFRLLGSSPTIELKVFYTWSQTQAGPKFDPEFGRSIEWDIPLLDGYMHEFVENVAKKPGSHHFWGIDNPTLVKTIEAWGPDILLVIGWSFKSHLHSMRYFKGRIPVLFKGDSTLLDEQPGLKKVMRRLFLRWVYRHIDYALFVGKNNQAYFRALGLKESQTWFVPHAIDNERFAEPNEKYETAARKWREDLGIKDSDLVFLFAGKLEPKKDPYFMLKLAAEMPEVGVKFVVVGNGKLEEDLKRDASKDSRILFLGFQNQQIMPVLYRLCDIFVLPSAGPGETWGLSVNESMACKRPVIASDKVGCVPDLIENNKTGWIFASGDKTEADLVNKIGIMVHDKPALRILGQNAFEKVQAYSYSVSVGNIIRLIDRLNK